MTGQHRATTNDDYKPSLGGSFISVFTKRRDVNSDRHKTNTSFKKFNPPGVETTESHEGIKK